MEDKHKKIKDEINFYHQYHLIHSNKKELNNFYKTENFKDGLMCPCQFHIELCLEILNHKDDNFIYKGEIIDQKTYINIRMKETLNIIWRNYILNSKLFNPHIF